MKKKIAAILATVMVAGMVTGCGSKEAKEDTLKDLDTSKYVTLGEYQGMTVSVGAKEAVTDEDIIEYVNQNYLYAHAEDVEVTDRAIQTGDNVHYTCVGTMDGVVFEGGSSAEGEEWQTVIGSQTMIEGFEDGFIGMNVGETKDIVCTFPEPYTPQPDYSGKEAVFTVTVSTVTATEYPELTDELVAELGTEFATATELLDSCKAELEAQAQTNYDDAVENAILSAVLTNCEFQDPPQFLIDLNKEAFRANFESYAAMFGMDMATLLSQMYGMTEDEFNEQADKVGIAASQESIAIEAIADAEGLSNVSEDELMEEAEAYVANSTYYTDTDMLFADVDKASFRDYVVSQRVIAFLVENNTVE